MFKYIMIALSLILGSKLVANEQAPSLEQEFESLDWQNPGTYTLPLSQSLLSVPSEHLALVGEEAKKLWKLNGNTFDSSLEAATIDNAFNYTVYFFNHDDEGYIPLNDWEKIDPNELLLSIKENAEKENAERKKSGIGDIHIVGWIQEPTLDKNTNTVYWAFELEEEGIEEHLFNSVALKFGRQGFERMLSVGDFSKYKAFDSELDLILKAHSFDDGHRYSDYTIGDKVATYGIATLVAATMGAKVSGGIILFKKVIGLIAAGIAALFYKFKKVFQKKREIVNQKEESLHE